MEFCLHRNIEYIFTAEINTDQHVSTPPEKKHICFSPPRSNITSISMMPETINLILAAIPFHKSAFTCAGLWMSMTLYS